MDRTAMPAAPTNTMASAQANSGPVNRPQGGTMGSKAPPAYFSEAQQRHWSPGAHSADFARRAVPHPRRLYANITKFMLLTRIPF